MGVPPTQKWGPWQPSCSPTKSEPRIKHCYVRSIVTQAIIAEPSLALWGVDKLGGDEDVWLRPFSAIEVGVRRQSTLHRTHPQALRTVCRMFLVVLWLGVLRFPRVVFVLASSPSAVRKSHAAPAVMVVNLLVCLAVCRCAANLMKL